MKSADRTPFNLEALLDDLEKSRRSRWPRSLTQRFSKSTTTSRSTGGTHGRRHQEPGDVGEQDPKDWQPRRKERARLALEHHPTRTAEEVRRAEATVAPILESQAQGLEKLASARALTGHCRRHTQRHFCLRRIPGGVGALFTGTGFTFRPFGVALVNRRGARISRVRALWRATVTWSPVIALAFVLKLRTRRH